MIATPLQTKCPAFDSKSKIYDRENNKSNKGLKLLFTLYICAASHFIRCSVVTASQASPIKFRNRQPDGNLTPWLAIEGSPSFHRVFDEEGYTVIVDEETEEYVYGQYDNLKDNVVSSGKRVGEFTKNQLDDEGINPGIKPSKDVILEECGKFCSDETEDFDMKYSFIKGADRNLASKSYNQGVLRNMVVLIRFSDHMDRTLPSINDYSLLFNGFSGPGHVKSESVAPTGSVKDVYKTSSYNKLEVVSTVIGWVNLPEKEAYYADKSSGATAKFEEALHFAMNVLDKRGDILLVRKLHRMLVL